MRYFCRVAYDGTPFAGWQRQAASISIQQLLEEKAATVLRAPVAFTGAGRTDAGVHAQAQGAHFDVDGEIDVCRFTTSMNALLPPQIAIYNLRAVDASFHARYSARSRRYAYSLCTKKSPLMYGRAWQIGYTIDWGVVMAQATALVGEHDFSTFQASGSGSKTAICTVFCAGIERRGECMVFFIEANRFVYKMVRSITGTLVDIGRGAVTFTLAELLARGNRSYAGTSAPPCGLVLESVGYAEVE